MGPRRYRRGSERRSVNCRRSKGFNGAATLPSRIVGLVNGEIRIVEASMGPRRYRRGSARDLVVGPVSLQASMGPRRYRRGSHRDRIATRAIRQLQWGRDVTVADRTVTLASRSNSSGFNGAATLPSRIARTPSRTVLRASTTASMGPRRYRRGSVTGVPVSGNPLVLQWGRDVTVADRCCDVADEIGWEG